MAWWCWLLAASVLWMATFGFWLTLLPPLLAICILAGALMHFYVKTRQPLTLFQQNLITEISAKSGIRSLLDNMPGPLAKLDRRLTGSHIIDESLQEIIHYLMRDFVSSWFGHLSDDGHFERSVRESLQKVIVNVAARIKEVDWIPYLTTRLVDDAATHLKLYRLSCEKMKTSTVKKPAPQSLASFKSATEGCHSRNNSDGGTKIKTHSRNSSLGDKPADFETVFFHAESEAANNRYCHEKICTNRETEKSYLNELVDAILFLVLPQEDFQSLPARHFVREILIGGLLLPLLDMLSEPDCVNRTIVWLCSDDGITSEAFLSAIRVTSDRDELSALHDFVAKEITILRSRDGAEGVEAEVVKQQLNSLMFIKKTLELKQAGIKVVKSEKLVQLPLRVIMSDSLASAYLYSYMINSHDQRWGKYALLHVDIERWKSAIPAEGITAKYEQTELHEKAVIIVKTYLSKTPSNDHIVVDSKFIDKLLNEPIHENSFDNIEQIILKAINDSVLPDFYKSKNYLKLLTELDLVKYMGDNYVSLSLFEQLGEEEEDEDDEMAKGAHPNEHVPTTASQPKSGAGLFHYKVDIIENGIVEDRGKTYGIYALSVLKTFENGFNQQWNVYRRYSDFYDLQQKVKDLNSDLGKLPFPGKKTFNNMGALTLSKRMRMLNDYLQILLNSGYADRQPKLLELLDSFLSAGEYDKSITFGSAIESLVGPIKSSMLSVTAAVKTVPDNLFGTTDGLSRRKEARDENVPVRILLMLLDEVFDLQNRNQWLRRRIVTILRQIFGDLLTRKMFDYFEELTSAMKVAGYIASIRSLLWPNGIKAGKPMERDEQCKLRTKTLAKASLLLAADDFKHLLGSETIRKGLMRVFNTFQCSGINRRLVYVIFEGVSELVFPPLVDIQNALLKPSS